MFRTILFALAIATAGTTAGASSVTVDSVVGNWTVQSTVGNPEIFGNGTHTVRWGTPFPGYSGERSGFGFAPESLGRSFAPETRFTVGKFTHFNEVIYAGEHLDVARLNLTFKASFDGEQRTFRTAYNFSLLETRNRDASCANGQANGIGVNANGCADRVQLLKNDSFAETFDYKGKRYSFSLFGFQSGPEFWTIEDQANSTLLQAIFNVQDIPTPRLPEPNPIPRPTPDPTPPPPSAPPPPSPPPPTVIPLPAGAWLLLGAIGGLGAVRTFRRR